MKFWDTSALVPLLDSEPQSKLSQKWLAQDREVLVWTLTPVEIFSALFRKIRSGKLSAAAVSSFKQRLSQLQKGWSEITQLEGVRTRATHLLSTHSLRAADALQLAAALVAFADHPEGEFFLTFDQKLAEAAQKEGFDVPMID